MNRNLKKLERAARIIFDLFPPEELKKYEKNGVSLRDQFMEYCIKNTLTCPIIDSKRTIESIALYALHQFFKSGPKEEINFDIFFPLFF